MPRRPWTRYLLFGAILSGAYFVLPGGIPQHATYDLLGLTAVAAILYGIRRNKIPRPGPWYLFAAGNLVFVCGDMCRTYYENILNVEAPFPFIGDAFYLAAYVVLAVGLYQLARSRNPRKDHGSLIDAAIIITSFGVLSWTFLMQPYLGDPTLNLLGEIISVAYPLGDLVLLFFAIRMAIGPGARSPAYNLLAGSICALLAADTFYLLSLLAGTYESGSPIDFGYLLSYVIWGAAALHPSVANISDTDEQAETRLTMGRIAALGTASLAAPVAAVVAVHRGDTTEVYGTIIASAVLAILVLIRMAGLVSILGNAIARREQAETERRGEERFRSLIQNSSDIITLVDLTGEIVYLSPAMKRVLGHDTSGLLGRPVESLVHPAEAGEVRLRFLELLKDSSRKVETIEYRLRRQDGTFRQVETTMTDLSDDPNVRGVVLNTRDITERKSLQAEMTRQAFHDPLTDLANRALFTNRVDQALKERERRGSEVAVLFLDLDDFKKINDSMGHQAGDNLLLGVARRIKRCLRASDTPARLGGDEFAILLNDVGDAIRVADRITAAMSQPFLLAGKEVKVTASIGIAESSSSLDTGDDLLRNGDVAMYAAKDRGKGRYEVFTPDLHAAAVKRIDIEADLLRAINDEEFEIHYQPIVDLADGSPTGFEALVRWNHPERGMLPPAEFIGIAEESGLIIPIGRQVLIGACKQAKIWNDRYPQLPPLTMSVNISATQLDAVGLVTMVEEAISDSKIAPEQLILEVTENVIMRDDEETVQILTDLKNLGLQLAIDDFGTGYSSLSYLQRFPMDWLKLPRPFLAGIGRDERARSLARGIVELGRNLGFKIIAEGIEYPHQWEGLRAMDCDLGQGFYFAKPQPAEHAEAMLDTGTAALKLVESRRADRLNGTTPGNGNGKSPRSRARRDGASA